MAKQRSGATVAQKPTPHFDAWLRPEELQALVTDPARVAANAFLPFMVRRRAWIPYRGDGSREPKERLIRYASRRDSAIFSHYRKLLSEPYELRLRGAGLSETVLAYRKIPASPGSTRGKCNIHFARDAFDAIAGMEKCCAVVTDISKFFDCIDHELLKQKWSALLGVSRLPEDHYAVFKAITAHASVDFEKVLARLGYKDDSGGRTSRENLPVQLCSAVSGHYRPFFPRPDFLSNLLPNSTRSRSCPKPPVPAELPINGAH